MRILKYLFLSVFGLISLILILILGLWTFPETVLTDARVNELFSKYAHPLFTKQPDQVKFSLVPFGWNGKHVELSLSHFCTEPVEGCFEKTNIEFAFKISRHLRIKVESIGPIEVNNQSFTYRVNQSSAPPHEPESPSFLRFFEFPTNLEIKMIQLAFPEVSIIDGKTLIKGSLSAQGSSLNELIVKAEAHDGKRLSANADIQTALIKDKMNPFHAEVYMKAKKIKISGDLKGSVNWSTLQGNLEGGLLVTNLFPWMKSVSVRDLKIVRNEQFSLSAQLQTKVSPDIDIQSKNSSLPKAFFSPVVTAHLIAKSKSLETFNYEINLGPYHNHGIKMMARATGNFPFPENKKAQFGLDQFIFGLEIGEFQSLVQSLKDTRSAIPAPASSLMGPLYLTIGKNGTDIVDGKLPIQLVTKLKSKEQVLKTESSGSVDFLSAAPQIAITGETLIQTVLVTLPDLDVLAPKPTFKYDSRITLTSKKTEPADKPASTSPQKIILNWKIKSLPAGIQIIYPVFIPYAPLEVEWSLGKETAGEIRVKPFQLEYLKRKATVTRLRYFLKAGDPRPHFEGNLVIQKTDYTISLDIFDEDSKPRVVFSSTPPLQESDIVSVLLFNQTSAELDPDQTSSVASTQAAVANRALGLFSIFALSSTPIEAVNFNPSSRVYSARVKLANGLTATVGTDWEKAQEVALRKRLGKSFVLSTIFQTDPDTNAETTKTLLEWFRRF